MNREEVIKGLEIVWDAFNHMEHELYADYVYDALALLRAQEPRVMTIEEALEAEYVYLDVRLHSSLQCECCILIVDVEGDIVPVKKGFWGSLEGEDYGIDWRCWTSRPTDEQRRATPWD